MLSSTSVPLLSCVAGVLFDLALVECVYIGLIVGLLADALWSLFFDLFFDLLLLCFLSFLHLPVQTHIVPCLTPNDLPGRVFPFPSRLICQTVGP